MSIEIEENKAIARRFFMEVWNQGRVELLDQFYAPDATVSDWYQPKQTKERILWWHRAAPGFKFTILDMVAEGETVVIHWRVDVTYTVQQDPPPTGPFLPLGKSVGWKGFDLMHFANGKLVSREQMSGWMDLLVEIGVIPVPKNEPA